MFEKSTGGKFRRRIESNATVSPRQQLSYGRLKDGHEPLSELRIEKNWLTDWLTDWLTNRQSLSDLNVDPACEVKENNEYEK
jgi:hypothetical protein